MGAVGGDGGGTVRTDGISSAPRRIRRRVVVRGRVQGVWYRDSCRDEARRLGVAGWVRNRDDGTVEAAIEGDPDAVLSLANWMQGGPPHAEVTGIDIEEEAPVGEAGFVIR